MMVHTDKGRELWHVICHSPKVQSWNEWKKWTFSVNKKGCILKARMRTHESSFITKLSIGWILIDTKYRRRESERWASKTVRPGLGWKWSVSDRIVSVEREGDLNSSPTRLWFNSSDFNRKSSKLILFLSSQPGSSRYPEQTKRILGKMEEEANVGNSGKLLHVGVSFNTELTYPKPRLCSPLTPSSPSPLLLSTLRSVLPTFSAISPSIALESLLEEKEDMADRRRCLDQLTHNCRIKLAEVYLYR